MGISALVRIIRLGLLAVPCVSQSLSLSGYVIDGVTNAPLSDIRLHLYGAKYNDPAAGPRGAVFAPVTPAT
jgi:hypothetical protein